MFSGTLAIFVTTHFLLDETEDSYFGSYSSWHGAGSLDRDNARTDIGHDSFTTADDTEQAESFEFSSDTNKNGIIYDMYTNEPPEEDENKNITGFRGDMPTVMPNTNNQFTTHSWYLGDAKIQSQNSTKNNGEGFHISENTTTGEILRALKSNDHMHNMLYRVGIEPDVKQSIRGV